MDELDDLLKDQTRASVWRELRVALAGRLKELRAMLRTSRYETEKLQLASEIEKLEAKVDALKLEEAVAQFSEDALRFTINASRLQEDEPEEPPAS